MDDNRSGEWWWLGCLVWPAHALSVLLRIHKLGDQPEERPESFCPTRCNKQGSWNELSVRRTSVSTRSSSDTMHPTRCLLQIATSCTGTSCIMKNNWITPEICYQFCFRRTAESRTMLGQDEYIPSRTHGAVQVPDTQGQQDHDKLTAFEMKSPTDYKEFYGHSLSGSKIWFMEIFVQATWKPNRKKDGKIRVQKTDACKWACEPSEYTEYSIKSWHGGARTSRIQGAELNCIENGDLRWGQRNKPDSSKRCLWQRLPFSVTKISNSVRSKWPEWYTFRWTKLIQLVW